MWSCRQKFNLNFAEALMPSHVSRGSLAKKTCPTPYRSCLCIGAFCLWGPLQDEYHANTMGPGYRRFSQINPWKPFQHSVANTERKAQYEGAGDTNVPMCYRKEWQDCAKSHLCSKTAGLYIDQKVSMCPGCRLTAAESGVGEGLENRRLAKSV